MRSKILSQSFAFLLLFLFMSCGITKNSGNRHDDLQYMRNIEEQAVEQSKKQITTLQPGDQLLIIVSTSDQDVAKVFNQNYSSQQAVRQGSTPGGNRVVEQVTENGPTYLVDSNGQIDFPILGKIDAAGLSIENFRTSIGDYLKKYIKDPQVHVKITNYKVTVLGEVRNPGQFVISDGQATLLNALGLAGDLTIYANRDDILVVRNIGGVILKERIDIGDASFIDSPFYNLKQGDVIYVTPNQTQEQISRRDPNLGAYISAASVLVAIIAMLIR